MEVSYALCDGFILKQPEKNRHDVHRDVDGRFRDMTGKTSLSFSIRQEIGDEDAETMPESQEFLLEQKLDDDRVNHEHSARHVFIDFVAGSIGATTSVYVGQPLDTLKVKMQTFPHLYPNLKICLSETLRKDGIVRGLYAGTVPSLAANVAENSVLFASYGICQKFVAEMSGIKEISELSTFSNGCAGFIAAFFSSLVLCPTELVKCRLQAMRESHIVTGKEPPRVGPFKLTGDILRAEGVRGLFHGLSPTFAREMPGYFCFFFTYEFMRELLTQEGQRKEEIGPLKTIVSGGMAGVTLWTAIFPADVIKSRQQVSGSSGSMLSVARQIIRSDGALALYNGLTPTIIRTFPATGALFFAYEYSKKLMLSYS